jgi:hypothetical protein
MAAFVARYASAFARSGDRSQVGHGRDRRRVRRFSGHMEWQPELREFFVNPAIPAVQKVGFWIR